MSDAPVDPRRARDLPELGALPVLERVSELAVRVLAPNPSPMTLDGTNTYVLSAPGSGVGVVVDPGPLDVGHLERVERVLVERDVEVADVLVTHHHADHVAAASDWARRWGARLHAPDPEAAGLPGAVAILDGGVLRRGGLRVEFVATPGHTRDHTSFRLGDGALLTGDHVLGRGTSVVAHPDGDLGEYLDSLRRTLELGPDLLLPGHGPVLRDDPAEVLEFHLAHRAYRIGQILEVVAARPATPREIVEIVYAEVDVRLWDAAEASTRAAVDHLAEAGRVEVDDSGRVRGTAQ